MGTCLIFDCETTGLHEPQIIEAAWMLMPQTPAEVGHSWRDVDFEQRYKPSKRISYGAMAAHHISDADLEDCPPSADFKFPIDTEYLIGHNIDYDWRAAGAPEDIKRICTLAMARTLWPQTDSHSQVAMLYLLVGPAARDMAKEAHNASNDVLINLNILRQILYARPEIQSWGELWAFSERCRVPTTMEFGKWGPKDGQLGKSITWVLQNDSGYVDWLLRQDWLDKDHPYLRQALTQ